MKCKMAKHYGALLMFDEVITGFRFSTGGAQELTNVVPDLAAFAKAISNAIPLSAITGKKEYMNCLNKTFFSFTYGGDCIGLAAAKACIPKIKNESVTDHLWEVGLVLKNGINELAISHGISEYVECIGYPCRTVVTFNENKKYFTNLEMKSWFQQELIHRGILWTAYHALSYSHKIDDINYTLNCFDEIFILFKKIIENNKKLNNYIEGKVVEPVFRKVTDFNAYIQKDK